MAKLSGITATSITWQEASAPSTPASTKWVSYFKTDGMYYKDDAGAETGPLAAVSGSHTHPGAVVTYTAGDISLTSTSVAVLSGPGDCVVAASSGDVLLVGISARTENTTGNSIALDVATIVSASPVNYLSSRTGTPLTTSVPRWFIPASTNGAVGGVTRYVVQSGDISGGNVTLRMYYRVSGNRTLAASSTVPLEFWVQNTRQ